MPIYALHSFRTKKQAKPTIAALFAKIKDYQTQNIRDAQCFLCLPAATTPPCGYGRFRSSQFRNFTPPIGDEPYDVGIANLEKKDNLYLPFQGCAGVEGTLVLATPDSGVAWVTGDFKMRAVPMWTGADGEHLYEGRLTFKVRYDATGIYAKKGYGKGTTEEEFGFWAVRSLQENMLEEPDAAQLTERLRLAVELNTSAIQDEENSKPQKAPKPPIPDPQHWFYRGYHNSLNKRKSQLEHLRDRGSYV